MFQTPQVISKGFCSHHKKVCETQTESCTSRTRTIISHPLSRLRFCPGLVFKFSAIPFSIAVYKLEAQGGLKNVLMSTAEAAHAILESVAGVQHAIEPHFALLPPLCSFAQCQELAHSPMFYPHTSQVVEHFLLCLLPIPWYGEQPSFYSL